MYRWYEIKWKQIFTLDATPQQHESAVHLDYYRSLEKTDYNCNFDTFSC